LISAFGNILSALGLAALAGGMLFFAAVMAPLVFTQLAPDAAGPFIRAAFPFYYAYVIVTATFAACGFLVRRDLAAITVLLVVVVLTYWSWFWLLPHIEVMRLAGDMAGFDRGHTLSVWVNGAEFLGAVALLVRTAIGKDAR
jgi:hypothetical protein